jgi:hypothetical protein
MISHNRRRRTLVTLYIGTGAAPAPRFIRTAIIGMTVSGIAGTIKPVVRKAILRFMRSETRVRQAALAAANSAL